jgi:hypothetical protein
MARYFPLDIYNKDIYGSQQFYSLMLVQEKNLPHVFILGLLEDHIADINWTSLTATFITYYVFGFSILAKQIAIDSLVC